MKRFADKNIFNVGFFTMISNDRFNTPHGSSTALTPSKSSSCFSSTPTREYFDGVILFSKQSQTVFFFLSSTNGSFYDQFQFLFRDQTNLG